MMEDKSTQGDTDHILIHGLCCFDILTGLPPTPNDLIFSESLDDGAPQEKQHPHNFKTKCMSQTPNTNLH